MGNFYFKYDYDLADSTWENAANWFSDANGATPAGSAPSVGDAALHATGDTTIVAISSTVTVASCAIGVEVGSGGVFTCSNCTGNVSASNGGSIAGGSFTTASTDFSSVIYGGTFSGGVSNGGSIAGGTFNGQVDNYANIGGGTFNGSVFNGSGGTLSGGAVFNYELVNNNGDSGCLHDITINGLFQNNSGAIFGSNITFSPAGTVGFSTLVVSGKVNWAAVTTAAAGDPGFVAAGGSYLPRITVTSIPTGGEILGAGLL